MNEKRILLIFCEEDVQKYSNIIEKNAIDDVVAVKNKESLSVIDSKNNRYFIGNRHWDLIVDFLKDTVKMENVRLIWKDELICNGKFIYERLLEHSKQSSVSVDKYMDAMQEKKIAYVFGNCQSLMIGNGCMKSIEFSEEYYLMVSQPVHRLGAVDRQQGMNKIILKSLSLFIYQNVSDDNIYSPKLASNYILNQLSDLCKKICIPNIYFSGYFPNKKNGINPCTDKAKFGNGLIPYQDIIEDDLFKGSSIEYVCKNISKDSYFTIEEIQQNYKNSLNELKKRESVCDIKVSEYIEKNYQKEKLFYAVNHPSNSLLKCSIEQILEMIFKKKISVNLDTIEPLNIVEELIYPSVKSVLGLQFESDKFIFHKKLVNKPVEVFEYIRLYRDSLLRELYKKTKYSELINQPIFLRKLLEWLKKNNYANVGLVCNEKILIAQMLQFVDEINCDIITEKEIDKVGTRKPYDVIIAIEDLEGCNQLENQKKNIYNLKSICRTICLNIERTCLVPDVQKHLYQEQCCKCIYLKVEPYQNYYINKKEKTSRFVVFACNEKPVIGTEVRNVAVATNVSDEKPIQVSIEDEKWMVIYLAAEGFCEMPDIEIW